MLKGGEYFGVYEDRMTKVYSPAQKYRLDHPDTKETINDAITNATEVFKDDVMSSATPKRLSDAHLDLEVFNDVFNITDGFAVCELNSSATYIDRKSITFKHNIISYVKDGKVICDRMNFVKDDFDSMFDSELRVQAFVEFSYDTIHDKAILIAYEKIHSFMINIAKHMKNLMDTDTRNLILVYRFKVNNDGTFVEEINNIARMENSDILISAYGNYIPDEERMNIPDTKDSFAMDEGIVFDDALIQVEHSEGRKGHKSNIIEFIIRSIHRLTDDTNTYPKFDSLYDELFACKKKIKDIKEGMNYKAIQNQIANKVIRKNMNGTENKADVKAIDSWKQKLKEMDDEIIIYQNNRDECLKILDEPAERYIETLDKKKNPSFYRHLMRHKDMQLKYLTPPMQMAKIFIQQLGYPMENNKFISDEIKSKSPFRLAWPSFTNFYFH